MKRYLRVDFGHTLFEVPASIVAANLAAALARKDPDVSFGVEYALALQDYEVLTSHAKNNMDWSDLSPTAQVVDLREHDLGTEYLSAELGVVMGDFNSGTDDIAYCRPCWVGGREDWVWPNRSLQGETCPNCGAPVTTVEVGETMKVSRAHEAAFAESNPAFADQTADPVLEIRTTRAVPPGLLAAAEPWGEITHAYVPGLGLIDMRTHEVDATSEGIVVRLTPEGGEALSIEEDPENV